ncbi:MAG: hypothetical protein DRH70_05625 [Candidatus Coatesbacteria bacterium]|nr:MAG: hypothetical protein DRH70_05625 [Candidatus Coatesbacteria bacterium]
MSCQIETPRRIHSRRRPCRAQNISFACLTLASFLLLCTYVRAQEKLFSATEKTQKSLMEMAKKEDTVQVYAIHQHYDAKTGIATLEGDVDIRFGEVRLRADKIIFNRRTMETVATGNIVLEYQKSRIVGDKLEMNLRTRLGKVYSAEAYLDPSYFIKARELERFKLDRYRVYDATFSSCSQDVPDWSFKMKRATIHVDHYIYLRHGSMWVKKFPVAYLPYWIYPVKPARTTGFLMPEMGSSSRLGSFLKTSFFWATTENTDATFSLEYYDKGTVAQSLEFRYVLSPTSGGNFYVYHVSERPGQRSDETTTLFNNPSERWQANWKHIQDLGKGFKATANINYISDKQFGEDYIWGISNRPQEIVSEVSLTKSWSQYYFSANVKHAEGLDRDIPTDTILQKLPEVNFVGMRRPIPHTPLFYQFSLQAASLSQESGFWDYDTGTDVAIKRATNRFDVYPQLIYPLNIGRWLSLTGRVGFRTTWYVDSSLDLSDLGVEGLGKVKTYSFIADNSEILTGRKNGHIFDKERPFERVVRHGNDIRREIYDCSLSCTGPSVHRIFSVSGWGNIEKVEHLITPSVHFDYIPAVNQSLLYDVDLSGTHSQYWYDLNYDGLDYIGMITRDLWGRSAMTYSLTNRIRAKIVKPDDDGKLKTTYRDLLELTLRQSYNFRYAMILKREEFSPFRSSYSPFSDVMTSMTVRPTETLDANLWLNYNPHKKRISDYTIAATYNKQSWHASLRYRCIDMFRPSTDTSNDDSSYPDTRYLTAELGCKPHPKLELYTTVKYNIEDNLLNQNNYTIVYHSQCWSLTFFAGQESEVDWEYSNGQRHRGTTRHDTQFSLSITLTNVGSSKVPFL